MKRAITLAVDQSQYRHLYHSIIERIWSNDKEIETNYISSETKTRIIQENEQLANLLIQLDTEYKHIFKHNQE